MTAVNDAPVNSFPGTQTTLEDTPRVFSTGTSNAITVADVDSATLTTTITITNGTFTALTFAGATITNNNTGVVTISGTAAAINGALNGASYVNTKDFNGVTGNVNVSTSDGVAPATVSNIAVTVNADPDIVADAFSTTRGTAISFNPITGTNGASADNFEGATPQITQIAGTSISVGGSVAVTNGSVSLAAGNVLTFTPTGGFSGNVPAFSYTVSSGGVTETANITVRVIGVSSITSPTVVETDAPGVIAAHVVTLTGATTSIITMPFTIAGVSATAGSDYNATPTFTNGVTLSGGILTIPLGVTTFTINVPIVGDTTFEPTETYNVVLDNVTSVGTITDNDTSPTVAVGAGSGTEGGNIVHTVTLSNLSSTATNYTYLLAGNTATTAVDYNPTPTFSNGVTLSGTTLTVPAGVLSFTVSYATIQDTLYEGNETYDLTIGGVAAVGTITDDEIKPSIAVSNVTVSEVAGSYAIFTVTLSGASAATVNAALTLSNGTAVGGTTNNATNDFKNDVIEVSFDNGASWTATTTAAFASGATSALVRVLIYENATGDAASENFNLIATPSAGQTSNASATGVGTILETNLTISNNNANEGTAVVHTVTMAAAFSTTVSTNVFFNIVGAGTNIATSGTDFNPVPTFSNGVTLSGNTLTIPANVTTFTVTVPTFTDTIVEPSETYQITIAGATGVGTINDLSAAPSIASVSTATATEGTALVHTVTITGTSTVATTYAYALNGVTATAGTDYNTTTTFSNGVTRAGATLTVPAGVTSFTVTVPTFQDTIDEPNETYTLTVGGVGAASNGTILDDDATPTLTVGNVSVLENAGFAVFTVSLSNPSSVAITGNLGLTAGTATGGGTDYGSLTGTNIQTSPDGTTWTNATTFNIAAGVTSIFVRTPVTNTAGAEPVETFTLNASAITNTSNATATGTGTIIDTTSPTLSINDITVNEAAGTATFTVTLSATSSQTITVDYNTTSTTAQVGADFTNTPGTLTFAPGDLTKTITVPIINDNLYEVTETFKVNLVNPINASISDNLGVGTITDNDTPTFSVSNVSVSDQTNGFAQFIVSLSNPSSVGTVFSLALASSGASPATGLGVDYGAVGATNIQVSTDNGVTWTNATAATIAANSTYVLVRTPITQDALTETSETFTLAATLTAGTATGATTATTAVGTGTITDVNNAPDAVNDVPISNIQEDTVNTTVAGNAILGGSGNVADSDPNNDTLSITGAVAGTNAVVGAVTISGPLTVSGIYGNLIINANGSYTYTLDNSRIQTQNMLGGQSYNDVFTYKITDGNGGYDTATISVAVLGTLDLTAIVPQPVAVFADGLIGEYYGYNDTVTAGNRVHSDDTLATKLGTTSNLDSVEDIAFIIDGRNAAMGGGSIVGTNKQGATNAADVIFNVRTLNYGFVPLVNSSLGSNASTAGGTALPAQDNNSNSTTTALANFLDQDSSTAIVQTGTPTAGGVVGINTGLGRTTDGMVRMSGNAYLERGNYDFRVIADDGFRLKVGGKTLLEFDGNQAPTVRVFKNVEVSDLISGLTSVELLYWEQGGNANLTFDFKLSSSATWVPFSLDSIAFFSVPNTPTLSDTRLQDIVETSVNQQYELRTGSALDGDGNTNTLTGQIGRDYIQGLGGDDVLYGYNPADLANITKDGADFLSGGAGNDTLDSGYGNDILDGGTGADDMTGGMGDDIYYIDNAGDVIHENANEGTDTVEIDAAYSPPGAIYTIPTNIENVLLKGSLNTGVIGNAADNRITGNDGNNALDGGAGDDRLIGGKGNDTLTGGTGNDIFEWGLVDKGTPGAPHIDTITDFTYVNGAYGTSAVILTNGTSKNFQDATNLHGDSIDLRDLLIGEQSTEVVTNGTPQIGNLLQFLDFAVTGAGATLQTTLHISSDALTSGYGFNGTNATGTNFVAGHEDQTIIFKGVDLYAATGVAAGNETLLLQALLKNGTLVVD